MNGNLIKRIICAAIGASVIACGVPFFVKANIGADCVTLLYDALANNVGLTIGNWTFIIGLLYLVIVLFFNKKRIGFTTVYYVVFAQFFIDGVNAILPEQHTILMGVIYIIIGIIICSTGSVICLAADVGMSIFDALVVSSVDKFKAKYVIVRYIIDGTHLIIGILLGGKFGLGTIISFGFFGIILTTIKNIIFEPIQKLLK